MQNFKHRVIVVTGATSGIGRAAALAFAAKGATVALLARRARPLEEVADACRATGGGGARARRRRDRSGRG